MFLIYKIKKEMRKYYRRNIKTIILFLTALGVITYLANYLSSPIVQLNQKDIIDIQNDQNVNTSDYMKRFIEYRAVKLNQKGIYDKQFNYLKTVILNQRKDLNKSSYLIYEYTKFFGNTKNCQRGVSEIYTEECPFKNCKFSCDSNDLSKSDALLFHESDIKSELSLNPDYIDKIAKMHKSNPKQLYILWNDEANKVSDALDSINFNWTLSYRYDSEVSDCSYGCYHKKTTSDQIKRNEFKEKINKEFKMRQNSAIGFISNCKPKYRMKFSSELRKYFETHIFGRCSSMIFLKSFINLTYETVFGKILSGILGIFDIVFTTGNCARDSLCEAQLLQKYKFFLSFESKGCHNYITEKFWRILRYNMIPVVIQPAKSYYESIAPPNSFIHIQDFDHDVKKLSEYLHKISNDFNLYFKHLEWKFDYDVIYSANMVEKRRMCELCYNLNREDSVIYYKNVSKWFNIGCASE